MSKKIIRHIRDMLNFSSNWTAENGDFGNVGNEVRQFLNGEWVPINSVVSNPTKITNEDGNLIITGSGSDNVNIDLNLKLDLKKYENSVSVNGVGGEVSDQIFEAPSQAFYFVNGSVEISETIDSIGKGFRQVRILVSPIIGSLSIIRVNAIAEQGADNKTILPISCSFWADKGTSVSLYSQQNSGVNLTFNYISTIQIAELKQYKED